MCSQPQLEKGAGAMPNRASVGNENSQHETKLNNRKRTIGRGHCEEKVRLTWFGNHDKPKYNSSSILPSSLLLLLSVFAFANKSPL